jgi:hypothetical protein
MITIEILRAVAQSKNHFMPGLPDDPIMASGMQIVAFNILISRLGIARSEKLKLLECIYGRSFDTSRQLTGGEAMALLEAAYPEKFPSRTEAVDPCPEFVSFINTLKEMA